jgi:ankyrin repeat protein
VLITLIDNGTNVNAMQQTHCQWTLIHILVEHENLRLVKLLFERGADVHAMNDQGKTPYQLSLQGQRGHREMVDSSIISRGMAREEKGSTTSFSGMFD